MLPIVSFTDEAPIWIFTIACADAAATCARSRLADAALVIGGLVVLVTPLRLARGLLEQAIVGRLPAFAFDRQLAARRPAMALVLPDQFEGPAATLTGGHPRAWQGLRCEFSKPGDHRGDPDVGVS